MEKEQLFAQMQEAFTQQKGYELLPLAKAAIEAFPSESKTYYYLSEAQIMNWDYSGAQESLCKLIELEPNTINHQLRLGFAQTEANDYESAIGTYQNILNQHPINTAAMVGLATVLMNQWKAEEALPWLEKAIAGGANDATTLILRAKAYLKVDKPELALTDATAATVDNTQEEKALLCLVDIYKKMDNTDKVVETYTLLSQKYNTNSTHAANCGHYLLQKELFDRAAAQYSKVIEAEKAAGWDATFNTKARAEAYLKMGNNRAALDDLNYVLSKEADDSSALSLRAAAHIALGNKEAALTDLNRALELETGFSRPDILKKRAALLLEMNLFAEAIADYTELSNDSFHAGDGFYGMGLVAQKQGDLKSAYQHWLKAKENHHFEAEDSINTYCKDIISEMQNELANQLESDFAADFEKNAQSPFLQKLFGKFWKIDMEATTANSSTFDKIPESMRNMILEAMRKIALTITDKGLFFLNPMKEDLRAYFRIENESLEELSIYAVPLNGKKPQNIKMSLDSGFLVLDMDGSGAAKMYMKESAPENFSEEDRQLFEDKMKTAAMQFLGEMANALKDAFTKK